ncbi:hypothetical protein ACIQB5_35575 [Streptomyces sp. NPDC088560]|uniref:hypothetical protein n=1 Tax=Streptomyces sp. NPDC088560 TaxID=3365868 RepID=UPI00382217DF
MHSSDDYKWFIGAAVLIVVSLLAVSAYVVRKLGKSVPKLIAVVFAALAGLITAAPHLIAQLR